MATSDPQKDDQRFVILRKLRDLPEALLVKSILDSADIECFILDENTIRMDWLWSNLLGGFKICVRKADADGKKPKPQIARTESTGRMKSRYPYGTWSLD